jgi:hypothetical protein
VETVPTTSPATTTTPATTTPATTTRPATAPPPDTVVPGFPATTDLEQFLRQLEADPDLAGPAGALLVGELAELRERNGRRQRDQARAVLASVDRWLAEGTLRPEFAGPIDEIVRPIAEPSPDERGDDDGDD